MCRLAGTCYTFKEHHRSTTCRLAEKCYTFYQHYRSIMCRLAEKYYTFTNTTGAYTLPALQEHHVQTGRKVPHFNFTRKAPSDTRRRGGGGGSGEGEKAEEEEEWIQVKNHTRSTGYKDSADRQ